MSKRDEESFLKVIRSWKTIWMNQKQNSEADYQNYLQRAFGVDANMSHSLAKMLAEDAEAREVQLVGLVRELLETITEMATGDETWSLEQERIGNKALSALAHGKARAKLTELNISTEELG